jgi:hypothetical protein
MRFDVKKGSFVQLFASSVWVLLGSHNSHIGVARIAARGFAPLIRAAA